MAYETYSYQNGELLKAQLAVQPAAVLDSLFAGEEREQRAGLKVFHNSSDYRPNPADEISCEDLIAWCNQNREKRYPLAASFITFAHPNEASGLQVWSEQAKVLPAHASNPASVLSEFIARFRPMSWSGSRAALIEANAFLLDSLEVSATLLPVVIEARAQLARDIAEDRERETAEDRNRDERFE